MCLLLVRDDVISISSNPSRCFDGGPVDPFVIVVYSASCMSV